jgi:tyrosyl-tRNA synthetase
MGPEDLPSLLAGSTEVVPAGELERKLALGRPLRVKLGLDPTAPVVTLGWAVVLHKLRQFQEAGHVAVLIVGDFTARVGDPSGRAETRPRLSKDEVQGHADRLLDQFWKVLDPERTEVRYNAEWLEPMDTEAILRLTASTTVARMLERDDFAKRYAQGKPISIMEFLYPLLQGMDSVAVEADVELGGRDQTFNLLVGRDLQRGYGQEPQVALTTPLLVGTDGVQKMSQSVGNYIGITDPPDEMFGKLVRVPDELIATYRLLALDFFRDPAEAERVEKGLAEGSLDPWQEKRRLAREVVDLYHGGGAGAAAEAAFDRVHKEGALPDDIPERYVPRADVFVEKKEGVRVLDNAAMLVSLGLANTKSEARRLIDQRGAKKDGKEFVHYDDRWLEPDERLIGTVWQVGKRRFARVAGFSEG